MTLNQPNWRTRRDELKLAIKERRQTIRHHEEQIREVKRQTIQNHEEKIRDLKHEIMRLQSELESVVPVSTRLESNIRHSERCCLAYRLSSRFDWTTSLIAEAFDVSRSRAQRLVNEGAQRYEPKALTRELDRSVDELGLSVRIAHCLHNCGIGLISELVQKTEHDMLKTRNFGRRSLKEIRGKLASRGLKLGMKVEEAK